MPYYLTQAAEQDVRKIFLFSLKEFGKAQALAYRDVLKSTLQFLADNPKAAGVREELIIKDADDLLPYSALVRVYPVRSHIILYAEGDDGVIYILRICHAHEDWL